MSLNKLGNTALSSEHAVAERLSAFVPPQVVSLSRSRLEELCRLEARCYPSPWSPELIRAEFEKEISFRLGLLLEKDLVAYSFSYLIGEDMHLLNLAVAPECQGQGFGKYLLCSLLQRAAVRRVQNVYLEVRSENRIAQKLYRALGFRRVAIRKAYYRNNHEDAHVLELQLSSESTKFLEKLARSALE